MSKGEADKLFELDDHLDDSATIADYNVYSKIYPDLNAAENFHNHCTACNTHLGLSLQSVDNIRLHPVLKVTICKKCYLFYTSGEFDKGDDGSELYCRWCGQGGQVYCCTYCIYVFCKKCIKLNFNDAMATKVATAAKWKCFRCKPDIMLQLRARHHTYISYLQNRQNKYFSDLKDTEREEFFAEDRSRCCQTKKKQVARESNGKGKAEPNKSGPSEAPTGKITVKRTKDLLEVKTQKEVPGPARKKARKQNMDSQRSSPDLITNLVDLMTPIVELKEQRPTSTVPWRCPQSSNSVAQTLFTQTLTETAPKKVTPPPPLLNVPIVMGPLQHMVTLQQPSGNEMQPLMVQMPSNVPLIQPFQPNLVSYDVPITSVEQPVPGTSADTICQSLNGYQINLKDVVQRGSLRLPDGNLIVVRKRHDPNVRQATVAPMRQQVVDARQVQRLPQLAPKPSPPKIISRGSIYRHGPPITVTGPNGENPSPRPMTVVVNRYPTTERGRQFQNSVPRQPAPMPTFNIKHQIRGSAGPFNPTKKRKIEEKKSPRSNYEVSIDDVRNYLVMMGKTSLMDVIKTTKTAALQFANKLDNLQVSKAYSSIKTMDDLRKVYSSLSYLLGYAVDRFSNSETSIKSSLKRIKRDILKFEEDEKAAKAKKEKVDEPTDDVQVVENEPVLPICIESDGEGGEANGGEGEKPDESVESEVPPASDCGEVTSTNTIVAPEEADAEENRESSDRGEESEGELEEGEVIIPVTVIRDMEAPLTPSPQPQASPLVDEDKKLPEDEEADADCSIEIIENQIDRIDLLSEDEGEPETDPLETRSPAAGAGEGDCESSLDVPPVEDEQPSTESVQDGVEKEGEAQEAVEEVANETATNTEPANTDVVANDTDAVAPECNGDENNKNPDGGGEGGTGEGDPVAPQPLLDFSCLVEET